MINKKRFGKRISEFRRKLGLSQTQLAEKLYVSAQAVSKWENGVALPDIELLLQLSRLYRISVNELLENNALPRQIISGTFEEKCGIAVFVPPSTEPEDLQWEREMRDEGWIARNWHDA